MVVIEVRESWGGDRPFWGLAPIHNEGPLGTRTSSTGRFDSTASSGDLIIVRMNIKISFGEPVSGSVRRQAAVRVCGSVCGGEAGHGRRRGRLQAFRGRGRACVVVCGYSNNDMASASIGSAICCYLYRCWGAVLGLLHIE